MADAPHGWALAVERNRQQRRRDDAEVIDLVRLPVGRRPTPIAYLDYDEIAQCRVMECAHYHDCLTFASEVRWRSFHCRQCPKHPDRAERPSDETAEVLSFD